MKKSDNITELAKSLSMAQSQMEGALTDSENPFYRSAYADLASVWRAIRKPLTDNLLSVVQLPSALDHKVTVETILLHSSGQFISEILEMSAEKLNPQEIGKLITYMRRYGLAAITGIHQIDDDAESAMKREVIKVGVPKKSEEPPPLVSKCEHLKWLKSKYNEKEEYCIQCKAKRPFRPTVSA